MKSKPKHAKNYNSKIKGEKQIPLKHTAKADYSVRPTDSHQASLRTKLSNAGQKAFTELREVLTGSRKMIHRASSGIFLNAWTLVAIKLNSCKHSYIFVGCFYYTK